jgi:hypothetical protein
MRASVNIPSLEEESRGILSYFNPFKQILNNVHPKGRNVFTNLLAILSNSIVVYNSFKIV